MKIKKKQIVALISIYITTAISYNVMIHHIENFPKFTSVFAILGFIIFFGLFCMLNFSIYKSQKINQVEKTGQ